MTAKITYVYIMWCAGAGAAGMAKVGISTDPAKRRAQLATSSPFEIELFAIFGTADRFIASSVEAAFHHVFRDRRRNGEWFEMTKREAVIGVVKSYTTGLVALGGFERDEADDYVNELSYILADSR
jgi:hypothetical protein